MSWTAIAILAAGAYGLKVGGLILLGGWRPPTRVASIIPLLPVALLAALVVVQTFADGRELTLDARAAGMLVATAAVLLRAPFPVVLVSAAVVTAGLRALA